MDYFVGPDNITADKDYKHIFKWLCNTILRESGCIVRSVHLTCGLIRKHLKDSGSTDAHINRVLDPTDKQDVVLAYTLLKDLWSLRPVNISSSTLTYVKTCEALQIYGELSHHLIFPYICVDLSLSEQLEHLSVAVYLILALYVLDDAQSQFIPTTLFVDISIMVKNAFFCIAKAKVDHPNNLFFLVLLGTDRLESLFRILHTMVGNDANSDILQLALWITSTTEVSSILAKHLEWDRSPCRLCLSTVSKDWNDHFSLDHIGPGAYTSPDRLHPSNVTLATPWKCGRLFLEGEHSWVTPILQSISSNKNASILAPYGRSLMMSSLKDVVSDTGIKEDLPSHQPVDSFCTPEVLDTTLGIQELEDAVADNQWHNSETYRQGPFSHSVQIGVLVMIKALIFHFPCHHPSHLTCRQYPSHLTCTPMCPPQFTCRPNLSHRIYPSLHRHPCP